MLTGGSASFSGRLGLRVIRPSDLPKTPEFLSRPFYAQSRAERELRRLRALFARLERPDQIEAEAAELERALGLPSEIALHRPEDRTRVLPAYFRVLVARMIGRLAGITVFDARLSLAFVPARGVAPIPLGIVSRRVITNVGVAFLVDAWQNLVELENMRYHALGTSDTPAESVNDTALSAELTTQYSPNNTRATGSLGEDASNVFRTVGTNTVDEAAAIREHGIFSTATSGTGVLWDRSVFAVINLAAGNGLESTYDMTASAGG